jgi:hypothetical protein
MQTRTYADLFALIQALCGVVFASIETGRIKALINRRAQRAYRSSNYWTRFLKIGEERYLSSDPIAATAIVADSGYFIATVGDTDFTAIGSSANTVGEYFVATGAGTGTGTARPALGYVPYTETGKSGIDSFMRIFQQAPYIATSVNEFDFTVTSEGATPICGDLNPQTVFVTYKAQFSDTYGPGLPDGLSTDVTSVPAEWFQYLAHGTYADYLRAEGQQEKAALADQEAEALLTEELIRLDENHTSGFVSNRIRTNANMQLRW